MSIGSFFQGLAGNLSELSTEQLLSEFGSYLIRDENITTGFKLIRDVVIITNKRILFFDKQGATGKKMLVESIYLLSIVRVRAQTAGFGIDDSELWIEYMTTPFLASHNPKIVEKKFEFPKKYNIQQLYAMLEELAYNNWLNINKLKNNDSDL